STMRHGTAAPQICRSGATVGATGIHGILLTFIIYPLRRPVGPVGHEMRTPARIRYGMAFHNENSCQLSAAIKMIGGVNLLMRLDDVLGVSGSNGLGGLSRLHRPRHALAPLMRTQQHPLDDPQRHLPLVHEAGGMAGTMGLLQGD